MVIVKNKLNFALSIFIIIIIIIIITFRIYISHEKKISLNPLLGQSVCPTALLKILYDRSVPSVILIGELCIRDAELTFVRSDVASKRLSDIIC